MTKSVLNIGGGSKSIPLPPYYAGWKHDLLDIDPAGNPDIVLDARQLHTLPPATYDAVYCANNLEHYHRHEGAKVIAGMLHVLKPDGFADVRVPDLAAVMRYAVEKNLDIDSVFYVLPQGPILVRDVIYGYHVEIEETGQDFYAHKTGFSEKALRAFFQSNGFPIGAITSVNFNLIGYFFRQLPSAEQQSLLSLKLSQPRMNADQRI